MPSSVFATPRPMAPSRKKETGARHRFLLGVHPSRLHQRQSDVWLTEDKGRSDANRLLPASRIRNDRGRNLRLSRKSGRKREHQQHPASHHDLADALRINAVTLERSRLHGDSLLLYQAKTGLCIRWACCRLHFGQRSRSAHCVPCSGIVTAWCRRQALMRNVFRRHWIR